MTPEQAKQLVAEAAIEYIEWDWVVGVGTGRAASVVVCRLGDRRVDTGGVTVGRRSDYAVGGTAIVVVAVCRGRAGARRIAGFFFHKTHDWV